MVAFYLVWDYHRVLYRIKQMQNETEYQTHITDDDDCEEILHPDQITDDTLAEWNILPKPGSAKYAEFLEFLNSDGTLQI
jgi:hypothetical protein